MRTTLTIILLGLATLGQAQTPASPSIERLGRGLIAKPSGSGGEFVSWRFLATDDPKTTTFDVLRDGAVVKEDLADATCFRDAKGKYTSQYQVVTKVNGQAVDTTAAVTPWKDAFYRLHLDRPADGSDYSYSPGDCSVGDVDGDGEYELFVKWDPSNQKDNSQGGVTGNVYLDCYKIDWTQGGQGCTPQRLWRIDLGINIRAGAHYTQYMVYDFDGDGRAELMCKTAPGSKDGQGEYVSKAGTISTIKNANNTKDWRNGDGRIDGGYEFLTVFEGLSGRAIHTVFYKPNRNATTAGSEASGSFNWDDRSGRTDKAGYGNRGERYLACVAHLDGMDKPAYGVFSRGYYTYAYVWAVGFDGTKLKDKWYHASDNRSSYKLTANGSTRTFTARAATSGGGSRTLYGNGNHNLSVGDVDGDGCDEIIWGSSALDHDGKVLYATGFGHGDAIHLADHNPERPGLEMFQIHEGSPFGWDLHDAATGEILYSATGGKDNGRGIAAQMSPTDRCSYFCSSNDGQLRSAITGQVASTNGTSMNFRIFWDGDLQEELFDGGKIDKWTASGTQRLYINSKNPYDYENSSTINGTKSTPNLQADLFGDWREEVLLMNSGDKATLNVFTTYEPTTYRVPTLMHDHVYRMGVAWQNTAYNQPPHLGIFLPDQFRPSIQLEDTTQLEQTVTLGDSIAPVVMRYYNATQAAIDSTTTPSAKQRGLADGFKLSRNSLRKILTLNGLPTEVGDYVFSFRVSGNTMYPEKVYQTIIVHVADPTGIDTISKDDNSAGSSPATYIDLSGHQLKERPVRKGVYIRNGQKIAVK